LFQADRTYTQTVMATQTRDTIYPTAGFSPLLLRALYSDGTNNVVFAEFNSKAGVHVESEGPKVKNESLMALAMTVSVDGETKTSYVYGSKGTPGRPESLQFNDVDVALSYGSREVQVPFHIQLNDFIMDKYPGTSSASSYASEVTLIDESNQVHTDYRIYMNNILNYGGFRFFQSSFDRDEQGTYLSVNHDFWGTHISYFGYALLTLGMLLTFFSKNTRFYQLTQKIKKLRAKQGGIMLLFCLFAAAPNAFSQGSASGQAPQASISKDHAHQFSELVVQDFKGRMKPMHTLSREIMRKIARKEHLYGLDADQILLGMYVNGQDWYHLPIIKLGENKEIGKKISAGGGFATYADFFEPNGDYKLRDEVRRVYGLEPIDRGTYEKELLKIDERVNIMSMVFSGSLLKIVPNPDDPNNTWSSTHGHTHGTTHSLADDFFGAYKNALSGALTTGNYTEADRLLSELKNYQLEHGGPIMPSETKIHAEIFLNNLNIFTRLAAVYMLLAVVLLFFLFLSVFKPKIRLRRAYLILITLVFAGFALHTLGLGLRWYVSGRAPWSNGYESMIYIAWTTTLAGIIFTRKSFGGLAATMVLAGTILFVATLSFLDPEITPLVPVLKSYWLTIHVSMEAGSYGFLMLGAIIGLINLLLIAFITERNKEGIKRMVTEMSHISELTLIGGLFMVSIGTYLGGVWANESWGRYWGWDAKETWALVTVLMYAFILHMRLIPKLKGLYAYNLATIFGLATVIMTYYGVNYYLSGLHSYATGDPVPIPGWVYVVVICLLVLSTLAYLKKRKFPIIS
jgi:cytochrome c-type biogenesis protein CcsB